VRPHLLLFVLLLRHPRLQLMRKQREVLPPTSGILAAWGLARSLATSSSASATPPKRGTRHQSCRCWHKMYQTMLSPGTPTLAAVAALWLSCAIETAVNVVESPGRRSGRRIAPLEKVGRRRRSHAHHDEPVGGGGSTLKTARPGEGEPNCDNPRRKIPYYRLRPIHFGH
jgi:hypothetical protein